MDGSAAGGGRAGGRRVRFITGQGQAGAQGFYGGGEDGGVKDGGEEM